MSSAQNKEEKNVTNANIPSHWTPMPFDKEYQCVPLLVTSSEYKEVEMLFKRTMKETAFIMCIERVQNPFMWEKYQRKKQNMKSENEKRLFHGTSPESVEAICKENFDGRMRGKNGTKFGQGSYFALNASYSHHYATRDKNLLQCILLAKVLVGSYAKGDSSYRKPPPKQPSNPASDRYDSCVNNILNPTIFVIFDIDQCYPEYVIKYSQSTAHWQVPKPIPSQAAVLHSKAPNAHATSTTASKSSGTSSAPSSWYHGLSLSYASGLNAIGVSSYNTASAFNSGNSNDLNASSASNTSRSQAHRATSGSNNVSSQHHNPHNNTGLNAIGVSSYNTARAFNSEKSNGHNPSSAPNTSRSQAHRATSGPNSASSQHHNTANRSRLQHAQSMPSLNQNRRSSRKNRRCSVM